MSKPQLAEKIGMSKAGIYLAIDKKRLSIDTLEKIAEALEVPVTVFFETGKSEDYIINSAELSEKEAIIQELKKRVDELIDQREDKKKIIQYSENILITILDTFHEFQKSVTNEAKIEMLRDTNFSKLQMLIISGITSIVVQNYKGNAIEEFTEYNKDAFERAKQDSFLNSGLKNE